MAFSPALPRSEVENDFRLFERQFSQSFRASVRATIGRHAPFLRRCATAPGRVVRLRLCQCEVEVVAGTHVSPSATALRFERIELILSSVLFSHGLLILAPLFLAKC